MEDDFYALLAGHAALTVLVPAEQITPSVFSQNTVGTALRYQVIVEGAGIQMDGSDGLSSAVMQIDIRAANVAAVKAVRAVLVGTHGRGGLLHPFRGIINATEFRLITLRDSRGIRHEHVGTAEFRTASLDFDIWSRAT